MIIAFYPGAGGNRFYHWLRGARKFSLDIKYDLFTPYQYQENRYPRDPAQVVHSPVIFTHNMNFDYLKNCWSGRKIYMLDWDYKKSLCRRWLLRNDKDDQPYRASAYNTICWHYEYYQRYPKEFGNAEIVDPNSYPEFFDSMQQETAQDPDFDWAWDVFQRYGSNAPVLELMT
jgi:hypothetical protein